MHHRRMRGQAEGRKWRGSPISRADLLGCVAIHGCTRLMDARRFWAQSWTMVATVWLSVECRYAAGAQADSVVSASSGSPHQRIRPCSDAYSDAGFEFLARNYPLRRQTCSVGSHLQRITRSSRSRPSLNRMASGCVYVHRTRTPTKRRQGQRGCGTSRPPLGDSSQATADQQHFCWPSTSAAKTVLSSCYGGALEAAGEPCSCRYTAADIALASWPLPRAAGETS